MSKTLTLLVSMALAVLLACGVAFAAQIRCPTGADGLCVGTAQDDTMTGTDAHDEMYGRGGADTMRGGYFEDTIVGEAGDDTIYGEGGRGYLWGDSLPLRTPTTGNDYIIGGPLSDHIYGGPGSDRIRGNPGIDFINGGEGNDRVWGGDDTDHYDADRHEPSPDYSYDIVYGQGGDDYMSGGSGERHGGVGVDRMSVAGGKAVISGGPGDDTLGLIAITPDNRRAITQVAIGGPGEDDFNAGTTQPNSEPPLDEYVYEAADGERDEIKCWNVNKHTVYADPLDRYSSYGSTDKLKAGRQYCDSLTIVR